MRLSIATLSPMPVKYRKRRPRPSSAPRPVSLPGPVLIAAEFVGDALTLAFDREIVLVSFDAAAIVVSNPMIGQTFVPSIKPGLSTPTTFFAICTASGTYAGEFLTMSATAASGIVSSETGGPWAGCVNLQLPMP